jgi:hypothetical protein
MLLFPLPLHCFADVPSIPSKGRAYITADVCANLTVAFDAATRVRTITGHGEITPSCVDPQYRPLATSVIIGAGIPSLGYYGCSSRYAALETVHLHSALTQMGVNSFTECSGLTSVIGGTGLRYLSSHAFQDCSALVSVTLSHSIQYIEWSAFDDCSQLQLTSLPGSLEVIAYDILRGCTAITQLRIGSRVHTITPWSWQPASMLSFSVSASNPTFRSDTNGLIWTKADSMLIAVPTNLTLTSLTLGGLRICPRAFQADWRLQTVTFTSVIEIEAEAFQNCVALTAVDFGASLRSISQSVFSGCTALDSTIHSRLSILTLGTSLAVPRSIRAG